MQPGLRWIFVLLALLVSTGVARADRVDDLIKQLKADDQKVRLSAAINLGRSGDKRAIGPLIDALKDSEKTVRGVAAGALGKLIDGQTDAALKTRALKELKALATSGDDSVVTSQAKKSADLIEKLTPASGSKLIYVSVGPMTDASKSGASMLPLMQKTVQQTIAKKAPDIKSLADGGRVGTGDKAFYVDGTLQSLSVKKNGAAATVSCNLSILVASYPDKSMFGFAKGSAAVEASSSDKEIDLAKQDCVAAVVEDVVAKQIVPTIRTKAGSGTTGAN